jgi:hypothetical protein
MSSAPLFLRNGEILGHSPIQSWPPWYIVESGVKYHSINPNPNIYIYMYNLILHYPMQYVKNCWVILLSDHNIKYICTIYTRLYTCLMSISRFSLRDKVTLRLLKLPLKGVDVVEGAGRKAKRMVLQCINGVSSNPVKGRTKIWQL